MLSARKRAEYIKFMLAFWLQGLIKHTHTVFSTGRLKAAVPLKLSRQEGSIGKQLTGADEGNTKQIQFTTIILNKEDSG